MNKKSPFSSKIKFFENKFNNLKEENLKLKIVINELKKKIGKLEAKKNFNVLEESQDSSNIKENSLREIYKIMKSENIEFELAGLIGEREYYKEKIERLEEEMNDLKKQIFKTEEELNQKKTDLLHLRNTIDSLNTEKNMYKKDFEKEKEDFYSNISSSENKLKKAFATIHIAKRKLLNEKNLLQVKVDQIMSNFINREKRLRAISSAMKEKESKLENDYLDKERKYIRIINDQKREISFLENKVEMTQRELQELMIKLNKYEEDLEFLDNEE